ncbi:hypothetical protein GCM10010402_63710 [Actinomadura luteofluorescens]|uniref:hypothetical protein n=1 Tax=Actinomadura luteofluorescens TaxID=46163 RepID=UPI00216406AD|nr:hypothetical protein [Actinomadura glauciflava]MCR3741818.1 hypothetical protein [Actinomadura glauciflava]
MGRPPAEPGGTGEEPRSHDRRDRARRAAWLAAGFAVSYGLVLTVVSDTFFWVAIPGMLGLGTVVLLALQLLLHSPFGGAVPYATDGTDRRGPVRYHYKVLVRRYLLLVAVGAAMVAVPLVADVRFLYPFVGAGLVALPLGTRFWLPQIFYLRKCDRVLKVYEFGFRSPVRKSNLHGRGVRLLTVGDGAPRMSAREPLFSDRWPRGIERGAWFAGDDPFGGVILVPGTGELMCMQPATWLAHDRDRLQAGPERQNRAERAGLARKSI